MSGASFLVNCPVRPAPISLFSSKARPGLLKPSPGKCAELLGPTSVGLEGELATAPLLLDCGHLPGEYVHEAWASPLLGYVFLSGKLSPSALPVEYPCGLSDAALAAQQQPLCCLFLPGILHLATS